jgi:peptidoglycan biosynthesis protein MviN/MurJ (putative lipid II flippase)
MAMLSSAMTTTYAEQVNRKNSAIESYISYTKKMFGLFTEASAFVQILSLIFGPFILIVILNHGAFDDDAVLTTFGIYQLISLSFIPSLMMGFLSRTMYIEGKFKQLSIIILFKFLIEITIMLVFINSFSLAIPLAIVIGRWFVMLVIFEMLIRHNNQMLNRSKLFKILLAALPLSIAIYSINNSIIAELIKLDTELIVWYYLPFVVLGGFGFIWFIQQKFELNLFKKLLKRFRNGK